MLSKEELSKALEAVIFAAGTPITTTELKKVVTRTFPEASEEELRELQGLVSEALHFLVETWQAREGGFVLTEVAEGWTFRTREHHASFIQAMREERPVRLSKAALETLAIVAYRQPVTKPEVDFIRGVDCGGTLRLLLDRNLLRIVGKKEEPGRPMLYGTTKEFLSFFNINHLSQLPTLREFNELTPDSQEEIAAFDSQQPTLAELSQSAKKIELQDIPELKDLDHAIVGLDATENTTRQAFQSQGLDFVPASAEAEPESEPSNEASGASAS